MFRKQLVAGSIPVSGTTALFLKALQLLQVPFSLVFWIKIWIKNMIKNCDLNLKLPQGKTKRIADIYGLSLLVRGGRYRTSYVFQQRVMVKGKSHFVTLEANTLKEARELAIKQYNDLTSVLYKGNAKTTFYEALCAYREYFLSTKPKPATLKKFNVIAGKYLENTQNIELHSITPEFMYERFIKKPLSLNQRDTVQYLQRKIFSILKLARVKDSSIPDVSSMTMLYRIKPEERHFASMSYKDINKLPYTPLLALSLYLLLRPNEVVNIKLSDINFDECILTVPVTKTTTNYKTPLSTHAVNLIKEIAGTKKDKNNPYLFEGKTNGHLNASTLNVFLKRKGFGGTQTAHAFRALGRSWMEDNGIKYEVAEACLSHKVRDNTFRAYARTDYLNERRQAMQLWSDYVNQVLTGS